MSLAVVAAPLAVAEEGDAAEAPSFGYVDAPCLAIYPNDSPPVGFEEC
ncbi:MAG TPA: hypothetical protein VNX21_03095 [Candidatus Thermoplasmatota archaeon]|nr:hypothetical protein [Candidatus Thermoplasmatota archaeon]